MSKKYIDILKECISEQSLIKAAKYAGSQVGKGNLVGSGSQITDKVGHKMLVHMKGMQRLQSRFKTLDIKAKELARKYASLGAEHPEKEVTLRQLQAASRQLDLARKQLVKLTSTVKDKYKLALKRKR